MIKLDILIETGKRMNQANFKKWCTKKILTTTAQREMIKLDIETEKRMNQAITLKIGVQKKIFARTAQRAHWSSMGFTRDQCLTGAH